MKKRFLLLLITMYCVSPLRGIKPTSGKIFKNKNLFSKFNSNAPKAIQYNLKLPNTINSASISKNFKRHAASQTNPSLWQKFKNWVSIKTSDETPHSLAYSTDKSFASLKLRHAENEYRDNSRQNTQSKWTWFGAITAALLGSTVATMSEENKKPDYSSHPTFKSGKLQDLRKFIEENEDPVLKKQWIACIANYSCRQALLNTKIGSVEQMPDIWIKGKDFERVINAKIADELIEKYNLNLLAIPKKSIFFDGKDWIVVTEKIQGTYLKQISLEQMQQLSKFAEETGYRDWTHNNLIVDKNGKIVFIDTEDTSFSLLVGFSPKSMGQTKFDRVSGLYELGKLMDEKAYAWWQTRLNELKNSPDHTTKYLPLFVNPEFEHTVSGLDLKKVRYQAKQYVWPNYKE